MPAAPVPAPSERQQRPSGATATPAAISGPPFEARRSDGAVNSDLGSLDWLLAILKEVTTGVAGSDTPLLQKANAVTRLGNLYLKAYRAAELERENAVLASRHGLPRKITSSGVIMFVPTNNSPAPGCRSR